jgi:hypothetical protein
MTTAIDASEIARIRFVKGELEAGLVFAANAIAYHDRDPEAAKTFGDDAEDCYATALKLLRQPKMINGWTLELEAMLDELRVRLANIRATKYVSAAA